ncbi:MAG: GDP-mannose 4,6-dehydratase [Deltaproteobacteria bacterium]|nr:GDP-mannose 4,6-dehydratase [Deltaproteobacteria bacterium]
MHSTFWKNKTVLVTGAHGFTGSHLCHALLAKGACIRAFVKNGGNLSSLSTIKDKITLYSGDVTDITSLLIALEGVDYVFNPAAIVPVIEARQSPQSCLQVNIIGAHNVAYAAMKSHVKKMLQISTCHIYGNHSNVDLPIKESLAPRPTDIYAASKYSAELCIRPLISENFSIVFTRSFAMYGPYQREQYFIPKVISCLLRGEIPKLGNSFPTRDYCYIEDIVNGYLMALEQGDSGEVYHFSSQNEVVIKDLYELIAKLMKVNIDPIWNYQNRSQELKRLFGDSTKAREKFGWKPRITLEEGLLKTIQWWKEHPELWK